MANPTRMLSDTDEEIFLHAGNCPACIIGSPCRERDSLFFRRAKEVHGDILAKTENITAKVVYKTPGPGSMLDIIGKNGQNQMIHIRLDYSDGLALEQGLRRWLHGED